ncbi:MAG: hypothetical protein U0441_27090 [Polyangiaceae bacterium]
MPPSPAPAARSQRLLHEDEDELPLPPLDGARDDDAPLAIADDDAIEEGEASGSDDGAPVEMDAGIVLDVKDEEIADGAEAARDVVDLASIADTLAFLDDAERDDDGSGLGRDEDDDTLLDDQESDVAGAGTGEDPSVFVDEGALPPLDEDDGAHAVDVALRRSATATPERARWRVVSGVGAQVPCWLVAASPSLVVASGPTMIIARDGGRVSKAAGPDIDAAALAASEDAIFAVTRKGALFASTDGGGSWATGSVPWPLSRGGGIAATPGRLWICDGGALWSVRWTPTSRPEPPVERGGRGVRAMIAAGSTLVLLSEKEGDLVIERLRGDDEAPDEQRVPDEVRAAIGDGSVTLAATPSARAIALLSGGVVHVSRDGGATFTRAKVGPAAAIAFAGDGDAARLVALTAREDRTSPLDLLLVELASDEASHVADVAVSGASGRAALAWDSAREVLWVASSAGLIAYERSTQH